MITKENILKLRANISELKSLFIKRFCVIALYAFLGALIGFYLAFRSTKIYTAKCTLMMEGGGKGMASGYASLARQFGIGGGGGEGLSAEKAVELVKSKRIVFGGLLQEETVDGKKDVLVNHYIDKVLPSVGAKFKGVRFIKGQKVFTLLQSEMLNKIYGHIGLSGFSSLLSKKEGIITIQFSSTNEDVAILFVENTVNYLSDFFTKKAVEKEQRTVDLLSAKMDSVSVELQMAEQQLANEKDHTVAVFRAEGLLDRAKLMRKVKILNILYAEGIKNLEVARFSLMEKQVIIQIIDEPRKPVQYIKLGKVRATLTGAILAGLFGFLVVFIKKQYKTILNA